MVAGRKIFCLSAVAILAVFAREALAAAPTYGSDAVTATAASASKIDVSWSAVAADPAVTGYKIERESPIGGGFTTIVANTGSSATSYSDTGLTAGVVYNYRISAINADGVGPASARQGAVATLSSHAAPTAPPSKPTALSAVALSGYKAQLKWTAASDSSGLTGYKIERDSGGGFGAVAANTGSANTNYTDANLIPGITYAYRVSAINAYGASSPSPSAFVTMPLLPGAPRSAAAYAGDGQATVRWLPPYFMVGGVAGYKISIVGGASSSVDAGNVSGTVITGLTDGHSYSFNVSAYNAAGEGPTATTNAIVPLAASTSAQTAAPAASEVQQSPAQAVPNQAGTAAEFYFSFSLWRGSKGEAVTALQNVLTERGFYSGPVTGYFGPLTEAAVKIYQSAHYISPVGGVGPLTRAYLNAGF